MFMSCCEASITEVTDGPRLSEILLEAIILIFNSPEGETLTCSEWELVFGLADKGEHKIALVATGKIKMTHETECIGKLPKSLKFNSFISP